VFVTVTASDGSSPALSVTITPGTGTPPALFPQPLVHGNSMQVYLDTGTFDQLASQPGTYTAAIAVTATGFPSLTVPVTLTVGAAISIIASPVSLTFSVPSGPTVQAIQLSGSGGAAVSFSVTSSVSGTGN